jgi:hypothetical protein
MSLIIRILQVQLSIFDSVAFRVWWYRSPNLVRKYYQESLYMEEWYINLKEKTSKAEALNAETF